MESSQPNQQQTQLDRSKEKHVMHYRRNGSESIPFWVATVGLSFGTISKIYGLLSNYNIKHKIAGRFGYTGGLQNSMRTNMRAIVGLRNLCAHHGRIWNRVNHSDKPRLFKGAFLEEKEFRKYSDTSWGLIKILIHYVQNARRDKSFENAVMSLIGNYEQYLEGLKYPDRSR